MKELTPKEAIKILHPDTSRDALWKIEYYAGFNAEKARLKAVEDACVVACEALEKQIPKKPIIKPWSEARCPTCGTVLSEDLGDGYYKDYIHWEYCHNPECLQRLDWGMIWRD